MSSISDTISVSSLNSINDPPPSEYHDDPFSDPRIEAIFGQGMVVYDTRLGPPSDVPPPPQRTVDPIVLRDNLAAQFDHFQKNFDSEDVQKDFLSQTLKSKSEFATLITKVDISKKVSILEHIKSLPSKQSTKTTICGHTFYLPSIRAGHLRSAKAGLEVYVDILLDSLTATLQLQGTTLNRQATISQLSEKVYPLVSAISRDPARMDVLQRLTISLILELAAFHQQTKAIDFLVLRTVIEDELSDGAYIRTDDPDSDPYSRSTTMISDAAYSSAINTIYNLTLRQIQSLLIYIFDRDVHARTEAKVSLLSSVPLEIRNDVALSPVTVLKRACSELYLTRPEILSIIFFRRKDGSVRCPECQCIVQIQGNQTSHISCSVAPWLVKHFQFEIDESNLTAPTYLYVQPSVAKFAKELIQADASRKITPLIGENSRRFVSYTVSEQGQPQRTSFVGSKPVFVTHQSGHSSSPSSRPHR